MFQLVFRISLVTLITRPRRFGENLEWVCLRINNENSLSGVLCITYLGALQYYFKPIREMPTGRGFADLLFIPKQEFPDVPAMILELKWNQSAETALRQIKDKKYDSILDSYHGNVLLVGINYDKKSKSHDCIIEQLVK